jgi:hypothetical protein
MAKDQKSFQNLSEDVERTTEKTMEQAHGAMQNYFTWFQKTMSSTPWGTDFADKWKGYAEKNIADAQDYVRKLSEAKTLQDVIRIQTEYMQTQMSTFAEQTKGLGETFMKAAASSIKVPLVPSST